MSPTACEGDPPTSRQKREALASAAGIGAAGAGGAVTSGFKYHVSACAGTTGYSEELAPTQIAGKPPAVLMANSTANAPVDVGIAGTLTANNSKNPPIVVTPGD